MHDSTYWLIFFATALVLNLSPGPDLIYVVSRTIAQGTKVGLASTMGACSGAFVHVLAVVFGLSAILTKSAAAFGVVKYMGAAYLVYLGVQSLKSRSSEMAFPSEPMQKISLARAFLQGMLIDVLNPKVAIFFMAFLPQFVRPDHGSIPMQLFGLGALVILVAFIVESSFVLLAARSINFFKAHPRMSIWLDRILGSMLIMLGLRLLFVEQRSA